MKRRAALAAGVVVVMALTAPALLQAIHRNRVAIQSARAAVIGDMPPPDADCAATDDARRLCAVAANAAGNPAAAFDLVEPRRVGATRRAEFQRGLYAWRLGRRDEAIDAWRNAGAAAWITGQGKLAERVPDWRAARDWYRVAVMVDPDDVEAYVSLTLACVNVGDGACVREAAQRAQTLAPARLQSYYDEAWQLQTERDWSGAEAALRRAIAIAPNAPTPYARLGFVFHSQGRYADAIAWYDRSLTLDPSQLDVRRWRVTDLLNADRVAEAIQEAGEMVTRCADRPRAACNPYRIYLAAALQRSGDTCRLAAVYADMLRESPSDAETRQAAARLPAGSCGSAESPR